jgi:hypothetical protein
MTVMMPRQIDEIARQHTQTMRAEAARRASRPVHRSRQSCRIRKQTGWGLIAIGLRIAESGGH